ncbi:MAG: glycogen debranching protein [Eubacterium sp.]|jgi:glycogen operon protein|nr:glycogen debranching protein [Eubacterium sp.]
MKTIENGRFLINQGRNLREGVFASESGDKAEITVWCRDASDCRLCLYRGKKLLYKVPMFSMIELGAPDLFSLRLEGEGLTVFLEQCEYIFEAGGRLINDPYMRATAGRETFGRKAKLRGRFSFQRFDWSGEKRVCIPYENMILYQCHLRGFTKHRSSGVEHPGTFSGFAEKNSYLQDLGVNTILFQPIYDFNEWMDVGEKKVNFWGYTGDACYFAPKASYAADGSRAAEEMKQMIKKIHQSGMNILMDIHFVNRSPEFIVRCLKYYVIMYHVDGFLVNTDVVSKAWIDEDPVLRQCKFLGSRWDWGSLVNGQKKLGVFNDEFSTVARRFLKSDEGQVADFFRLFKADERETGRIHYITQKNGFTLRDLVSYDVKHNEANGERNNDGTEFNYSWNCGQEGPSRKKVVNAMRLRQTKNALCMLLLGLASPMLLAGDEFCRTQKGNNNAYCHDNASTWVDWNLLEKNPEVYEFAKMLIRFRTQCPLYDREEALTGMDTRGVGAPGVSGHGIEPWEVNVSYYSREIGILFYGTYYGGASIYMIFNFHWDAHEFYLPVVNSTKKWNVLFDTGQDTDAEKKSGIKQYVVSPRSVVVFESEK